MIITLSNQSNTIQRQFMMKFKYLEEAKEKSSTDQYGRFVFTSWVEHATKCEITEIGKKNEKTLDGRTYSGFAYCSYKDKYNRETGKERSLNRALQLMVDDKIFSFEEATNFIKKI